MGKGIITLIVVGILIVLVGGFFILQGSDNKETTDSGTSSQVESSLTEGTSDTGSETTTGTEDTTQVEVTETTTETTSTPQTHTMDIISFTFDTVQLKIKAGDTVIWTNRDAARHTVTSDSGGELKSAFLDQGETYSHTFTETGNFDYHCTPHPYMKGRIIVE